MILIDGLRDAAFWAMHGPTALTLDKKQYVEHYYGNGAFDKMSKRQMANTLQKEKKLVRKGLRLVFV